MPVLGVIYYEYVDELYRGGATVLKVGGTNSAGEAKKILTPPHVLASGGQNIA